MVSNSHWVKPCFIKIVEWLGIAIPIVKQREEPTPTTVENVQFTIPRDSNLRVILKVSIPETMFFRKLKKDMGSNILIKSGMEKIQIGDMVDPIILGIGPNTNLHLEITDVGTFNNENTFCIKMNSWARQLNDAPSTAKKMKRANKIFRALVSTGWEFIVPKQEKHKHLCGPFPIGREKSNP